MMKLIFSLLATVSTLTISAQTNVVFYTSEGDFMVEIRDDIAPVTGGNFLALVNDEFYDGVIFHRVIDNFVVQGGDPTGTGSGGPGYTIDDEFHPELRNYKKTISMANSGPDTGGSQFFFNLADNNFLDYDEAPLSSKHAVFGTVTENWNIVEDIAGVPTDGSDRPVTDVVMDSIRVTNELLTGIDSEEQNNTTISVYPNPIDASSVIRFNSNQASNATVQLYDSFGKQLSTVEIGLTEGKNQFSLADLMDMNYSAGLYQVRILVNENVQVTGILIP